MEEQLAGQDEGVSPAVAAAWAATDAKREALQWLPSRAAPPPAASPGGCSVVALCAPTSRPSRSEVSGEGRS